MNQNPGTIEVRTVALNAAVHRAASRSYEVTDEDIVMTADRFAAFLEEGYKQEQYL